MATPVDQKLLRQTKFPPEFNQKVDKNKINVEVLKKWIARRLAEILGSEDDVVTELCFNLLESSRYLNIKALQIQLTGFLDKDAPKFCKELWALCISAQESPQGVPKELLEAKKQEIIQEKAEAERAAQVAQQQRETAAARSRDLDSIRNRERGERADRSRGFGGSNGRGGRGGRDFDSRRPPRSRSPPPRRRNSPYGGADRRAVDTYVPDGSRRVQAPATRRGRSRTRSISVSSPSRSPPRRRRRYEPSSSRSRSPPRKQRRTGSPGKHRERGMESEKRGKSDAKRNNRSLSTSAESRSPSPRHRRDHRRRYSSSRSPSRSPPRRRQRRRSASASSTGSHDRRRERSKVDKGPSMHSSNDTRSNRHADVVRQRPRRADPRLSRSPAPPMRNARKGSDASSRTSSRSRSRSRSRSTDRKKVHKRRRSLPRYDSKRHRNTSSPLLSSPEQQPEPKRRRRDTSRSSRSNMSDVDGDEKNV